MRVLVAGIGNGLRGDDAAGLEAVLAWQRAFPDTASDTRVRVELLDSPGIGLVQLFEGTDAAVLIDAVVSGGTAGQIHRIAATDTCKLSQDVGSVHGWGIPEALRMANALGWAPTNLKLSILGIEVRQLEMGAAVSADVKCEIPAAARAIEAEIKAFLAA